VGGIDEHFVLVHCVSFLTQRPGPRGATAFWPRARNAPVTAPCSCKVDRVWGGAIATHRCRPASAECAVRHPGLRPRSAGSCDPFLACVLSLRRVICSSKGPQGPQCVGPSGPSAGRDAVQQAQFWPLAPSPTPGVWGHFNHSCRRPCPRVASKQGLKNGFDRCACRSRLIPLRNQNIV